MMDSATDTTSADDPARADAWWAALVAGLSPAEEARLRRVAAAVVGAEAVAEEHDPAPTLLDLQDAAHAARSLARGLLLAIEGLGPGEEREALGRIGDLLATEIATLVARIVAVRDADGCGTSPPPRNAGEQSASPSL